MLRKVDVKDIPEEGPGRYGLPRHSTHSEPSLTV
jgi:hypothetical protein